MTNVDIYGVSEDTKVLMMLCTDMALPTSRSDMPPPLTSKEWYRLAQFMRHAGLINPSELLSTSISELGISQHQTDRISRLLSRGGQLAVELENLTNQGLWAVGLNDPHYPSKLTTRLTPELRPPILIGAGDAGLIGEGYLGVVGSRDVDVSGSEYAERIGVLAAKAGKVVVSGLARGVDQISMYACISAGGKALGVLAGNMHQALRNAGIRQSVMNGELTLVTATRPDAPFKVWSAMARNKLIYCLAEYGIVVASGKGEGGTWAGAVEVLEHKWVPLFVRSVAAAPQGNHELIRRGAIPLGDLHEGIIAELTQKAPQKETYAACTIPLSLAVHESSEPSQLSLFNDSTITNQKKPRGTTKR